VLFVDDEPEVLASLRRGLWREQRRWNLVFAAGAESALAEVAREKVDLIVSDLCMPGIDGVALLERIQAEHGLTLRVVLSGNADRATMERALSVAHAVLSKRCSVSDLRNCLERLLGDPIP
jgi:CheY-like chemotaxis protein